MSLPTRVEPCSATCRYTDDHEAAATKIQSLGRSKKDRKRVESIREQREQEKQLRELMEQVPC